MKKIFFYTTLILTLCSPPVFALTFSVLEAGNSSIDAWINGGQVTVLEDFEGFSAGWYSSLNTGVGEFTASGSNIGMGSTSYSASLTDSSDPYFSIQDNTGIWSGRYDTTNTGDSSQWLDSGDIDKLTLNLSLTTLTNLFFYMQDPSDVGAITTIGTTTSAVTYSFAVQSNAESFFVGITLEAGETLSQISWTTSTQKDGYGLDDFSTVTAAPVPEPASMLLFGIGLVGLAGFVRRQKKKNTCLSFIRGKLDVHQFNLHEKKIEATNEVH